jgi:hypothetical protein
MKKDSNVKNNQEHRTINGLEHLRYDDDDDNDDDEKLSKCHAFIA